MCFKQYKLRSLKDSVDYYNKEAQPKRGTADSLAYIQLSAQFKAERAEKAKFFRSEYDRVNALDAKGLVNVAVDDIKSGIKDLRKKRRFHRCRVLLYILLLYLYSVSQRPYGYTITRYRLEYGFLNWIDNLFVKISKLFRSVGIFFGQSHVEERTTRIEWSDGSTSTKDDHAAMGCNIVISCLSLAAFFASSAVLYVATFPVMILATIHGLIRTKIFAADSTLTYVEGSLDKPLEEEE